MSIEIASDKRSPPSPAPTSRPRLTVKPISSLDELPQRMRRLGIRESLCSSGAWTTYLQSRQSSPSWPRFFQSGKTPAWFWGTRQVVVATLAPDDVGDDRELPQNLAIIADALTSAMADSDRPADDRQHGDALALLDRAYQSVSGMEHATLDWWSTIDMLCEVVHFFQGVEIDDDWLELTLAIELPLALHFQFPEFGVLREPAGEAAKRLNAALSRWMDPTNNRLQECWPDYRAIVCGWTRTCALANALDLPISTEAYGALAAAIRQTLRITRADRQQMLLEDSVARGFHRGLRLAQTLPLPTWTRKILELFLDRHRGDRSKSNRRLLCESVEDSGPWMMQSGWHADADKIAVVVRDRDWSFELANGQRLLTGRLDLDLAIDSIRIAQEDPHQVTCWHSDRDIQLLEMQLNYEGDVIVDRTILLAPQDRLALVAHSVFAPRVADLEFRLSVPLASDVSILEERETRELYLRREGQIQSLVLPLDLPEWKSVTGNGSAGARTAERDGTTPQLVVDHVRRGQALYSALLFDLHPDRSQQPRTWRRLTIGKDFQPQPVEQAVGFRARIGDEQWLLFRRMVDHLDCFSVFGQHFNCELFFGRIKKKGKLKELVRIDMPPIE